MAFLGDNLPLRPQFTIVMPSKVADHNTFNIAWRLPTFNINETRFEFTKKAETFPYSPVMSTHDLRNEIYHFDCWALKHKDISNEQWYQHLMQPHSYPCENSECTLHFLDATYAAKHLPICAASRELIIALKNNEDKTIAYPPPKPPKPPKPTKKPKKHKRRGRKLFKYKKNKAKRKAKINKTAGKTNKKRIMTKNGTKLKWIQRFGSKKPDKTIGEWIKETGCPPQIQKWCKLQKEITASDPESTKIGSRGTVYKDFESWLVNQIKIYMESNKGKKKGKKKGCDRTWIKNKMNSYAGKHPTSDTYITKMLSGE
eukprot:706046_1